MRIDRMIRVGGYPMLRLPDAAKHMLEIHVLTWFRL